MKVTFKLQHPTGRCRAFDLSYCDIKVNGHEVGTINEQRGAADLCVRLQIKDTTQSCGWRWVTLKNRHTDFNAAKAYLKENLERILTKLNLELKDPD